MTPGLPECELVPARSAVTPRRYVCGQRIAPRRSFGLTRVSWKAWALQLDWRNRCVGGERLEDLCDAVGALDTTDVDELYDRLHEDPHRSLAFHRALLRVSAELLWERANRLQAGRVPVLEEHSELSIAAYHEILRRAGIEFAHDSGTSDRGE